MKTHATNCPATYIHTVSLEILLSPQRPIIYYTSRSSQSIIVSLYTIMDCAAVVAEKKSIYANNSQQNTQSSVMSIHDPIE